MLSGLKPPKVAYTTSGFVGSTVIRVTMRLGSAGAPLSICVHVGAVDVPLWVTNTSPLLWPTQTMSEFPFATAIALIALFVAFGPLIDAHDGPLLGDPVFGVVASLVRHSDHPPASNRVGLFGSRMKGAMKFACPSVLPLPLRHTSPMENGAGLQM